MAEQNEQHIAALRVTISVGERVLDRLSLPDARNAAYGTVVAHAHVPSAQRLH